MDDAAVQKLYSEVESLYRLDQLDGNHGPQEIPAGSRVLLWSIVGIWVLIGSYKLWKTLKAKKKN